MTALGHAFYFGIYGPILGTMVSLGILSLSTFGTGEPADASAYLWAIPGILMASVWLLPVALVVGLVPAGTTGLMYWWLKARAGVAQVPAVGRLMLMSLVGGATCVLFGLCLGAGMSAMLSPEMILMFIAPGMVAAGLCTLLADRRTRRLSANT